MPKQALAIMDRNGQIEKYGSAPLIDETPEGMSGDIRDPFVFERDNSYWMMLGGADKQEQGQLLIYHSSDLKKWGYKGRVKIPIHLGTMVECPGIISINGKDVLFLSLMGIEPQGDRFLNQFSSIYLIGELDLNHMDFHMDSYGEVDCGFDFYAPQVFYGKDSEPLMFGWFGCGDQILPTDFDRWRHGLTMPRQLSVENGNLYAVPVKQMEELYEEITIVDERNFHPQAKKCWKTELAVSKEDGIRNYRFGKEEDYWTLTIDAIHGIVTWDRSGLKQVISPEYGMIRTCQVTITKTLTVKLYNDNSFIEIYINKGEKVMSGRVFPL